MEQHSQSLLLPFQRYLLSELVSSVDKNLLLILARGLGLRAIVATLLKIYQSPENLVLVINASPEEERGLSEEVGMKLKVVGYEMPATARQDLYKGGGLLSVTSRILIVDMLTEKIPVGLLTGLVVLHAEKVTPTSMEAFIIRIFKNKNKTGFIKAFSDEPEAFTTGISPLQTTMMQLKLREVLIWPRFHEQVNKDLEKRKADIVELYQPLTPDMMDIQNAVIECMEATLSEIKRSNTYLEVEDLTVENALFRSFDGLVRAQLDPVWHRVGPKTKGLVADLTTLRKLQAYLLEFDCVSFNRFLETILSSQSTTRNGFENKNKSPWLFTPAADTIFNVARDRVYKKIAAPPSTKGKEKAKPNEVDEGFVEAGPTEEEEEVMREIEEEMMRAAGVESGEKDRGKEKERREWWLPEGIEPVLEEQPKWMLLAGVLEEIEEDLYWSEVDPNAVSNDTILVMCSTSDTCATLSEYLSSQTSFNPLSDLSPDDIEYSGRQLLLTKLSSYFFWKASVGKMHRNLKHYNQNKHKNKLRPTEKPGVVLPSTDGGSFESTAMKRKREFTAQRGQQPAGKRRRVRGGGQAQVGTGIGSNGDGGEASDVKPGGASGADADALELDTTQFSDLMDATTASQSAPSYMLPTPTAATTDNFSEMQFNEYFGLLSNEDLVVLRPYAGDDDDRMLEEMRPKFIVLYDPEPSFIRRIEAYRAAHQGLAVRVYFIMYKNSVEEQRYLSSLRKEKDAFERLIRERGSMAIPHEAEHREGEEMESAALRTISSRAAGGRVAKTSPPRVIVDVREFRSSLPSLLHAGNFDVVPTTISIGDYIITPEMCVERKSLPDLMSSFTSGRLFQQCEQMTAHYKQPILLIEFDEKKSFNMETYAEPRTTKANVDPGAEADIRSKIVLLTITFPRLRIIWSSSPYQTVDIFRDLKENRDEPDLEKAVSIGVDEDAIAEGTGEAGLSFGPQELLRTLPGITNTNFRYVMSKVDNLEDLCELKKEDLHELIGVEKGNTLHHFLNRNVTSAGDLFS